MHALEKIIADHVGTDSVRTGEIVNCRVDFAGITDLYLQTVHSFYEMNGKSVWDPDRLAFFFDHYSPAPTVLAARNHHEMRKFRDEQKLTHHFDINVGVSHQVITERGISRPGEFIVITDSHTVTHGALGAFGTGVGATDMAVIMITGEMWVRVPEVMNIALKGIPREGTYAKDIVLYILGKLKADGAVYKAMDFTGEYIDSIGVSERMCICNMSVEIGAKTSWMQPNDAVLRYVRSKTAEEFTVHETDPDYAYAETVEINIDGLAPQVAAPGSVDNLKSVDEVKGIRIDQGFIGSCTGGRIDDIEAAHRILKGKRIHKNSRLIITPASAEILLEAMEKGYVKDLMEAGAVFDTPNCGACIGIHGGLLNEGETGISSTNRNFPGRMGSVKSDLYLASPAVVAASVLEGIITDPIDVMD